MWEGLQAVRKEIEESVNKVQDNEEIHDGFQLRFVGKSYAKFVTGLPSETVLVPDNDWNNQEQNKDSQNIFITGDNLDVLKHLVNAYSGAIKMIYIDPPYNTGSDGFVYKDSFKFSDNDLKQKLGFTDTELSRLRALDGKCSMWHEYLASISHRGHGTNCPICNSDRQTSFAEQAVLFYIKKSFPDTISRYKTDFLKRMELNIYIPSKSVAIEYDGAAWHRKKQNHS